MVVAVLLLVGLIAPSAEGGGEGRRLSNGGGPISNVSQGGPEISIVNGHISKKCEWKFLVALTTESGLFYCAGALLSDQWVLTSAQCVKNIDVALVFAGLWNVEDRIGAQKRAVEKTYVHEDYEELGGDVALIKVPKFQMTSQSCVGTAVLPTSAVIDGTKCWIMGWGRLEYRGSRADFLRQAQVDVRSNAQCDSLYMGIITQNMLCAQGTTSDGRITDSCTGDEGGPLVCEEDGQWTVHGVSSGGIGCGEKNKPGIYTRVHEFVDWINDVMDSS